MFTCKNYIRLSLMIGTSVILMFERTDLETFQIIDHAYFNETRMFVALLMGTTMVVVMDNLHAGDVSQQEC